MCVLKIKGETGISGEVRAGSHLHEFCKPDFSNRPPFHGCVVEVHSFFWEFSKYSSAPLSVCGPV